MVKPEAPVEKTVPETPALDESKPETPKPE